MAVTVGDLADAAIAVLPERKQRSMQQRTLDAKETVVTRAEIEQMVRAVAGRKSITEAPWAKITEAAIAKMPEAARQELAQWGWADMRREDVAWMAACVALELRKITAD